MAAFWAACWLARVPVEYHQLPIVTTKIPPHITQNECCLTAASCVLIWSMVVNSFYGASGITRGAGVPPGGCPVCGPAGGGPASAGGAGDVAAGGPSGVGTGPAGCP